VPAPEPTPTTAPEPAPKPGVAEPPPPVADPPPPATRHVADADLDPRVKHHRDDAKAAKHDDAKPAKQNRGAISLTTTPSVNVFLGRTSLGKTPLKEASLPAGRNKLRLVSRESGIDYPLEVEVAAGETVTKSVTVGKGKLRIKALPWAQVVVDGNDLGTTPLPAQPLYAGTHTVVLTYKPENGTPKTKREQLSLQEGEDRLLEADLR
jgi:hypothetical protein